MSCVSAALLYYGAPFSCWFSDDVMCWPLLRKGAFLIYVGSFVLPSHLVPDLCFIFFNLQSSIFPLLFLCVSFFLSSLSPFSNVSFPLTVRLLSAYVLPLCSSLWFLNVLLLLSVDCPLQALVANSCCSICSVATELLPELASNVSGTSINPWQDNALCCLEERVRIKHHLSGTGHLLNNCSSTQCSLLWTRVKGTFISCKTEPF